MNRTRQWCFSVLGHPSPPSRYRVPITRANAAIPAHDGTGGHGTLSSLVRSVRQFARATRIICGLMKALLFLPLIITSLLTCVGRSESTSPLQRCAKRFSSFRGLRNTWCYCKTSAKTVKSIISVWGCLLLE